MNKTASKFIKLLLIIPFSFLAGLKFISFRELLYTYGFDLSFLESYAIFMLFIFVTIKLQVIIQMLGVLLGGLLTGYRLGYLQINHLQFLRANGRTRFQFKRGKGSGGRCNLFPPRMENGRYPILLFLLGGSFFNLFLGVTLLVLSSLLYDSSFLSPIFYCLAIICLLHALLIAIPMTERNGGRNSGLLALELSRDQTSLRAEYCHMKIFEGRALGLPLREISNEWFPSPSREELQNRDLANLSIHTVNRMISMGQCEEAAHLAEELFYFGNIAPSIRGYLTDIRIYLELVTKNRPEAINTLMTPEQCKRLEQKKSSLPTRYALAVLYSGDAAQAQAILNEFNNSRKDALFPTAVQESRNSLMLVDRIAAERVQQSLA